MTIPVKDIPKPGPEYHTGYAQGYADAMRKGQEEREQMLEKIQLLRQGEIVNEVRIKKLEAYDANAMRTIKEARNSCVAMLEEIETFREEQGF